MEEWAEVEYLFYLCDQPPVTGGALGSADAPPVLSYDRYDPRSVVI